MGRRAERGIVLVLVSALLTMLAMVALALCGASGLRRELGRGGIETTHAGLLARSGVERSLVETRRGGTPAYGGEDHDGDGALAGDPSSPERLFQSFRPATLERDDCPVEFALRPSYFCSRGEEPRVGGMRVPDLTGIDRLRLGYSGRLRGTLTDRPGVRGDTYSLRVVMTGGIFINGGAVDAGDFDGNGFPNHRDPTTGYNATLHRILGTLAEAIDRAGGGANDGVPVDQVDGERLVTWRPSGGWRTFDQVRALALGGSQTKADALRDYLLLDTWVDRKVIAPNVAANEATMTDRTIETWADILKKHADVPAGVQHAPGFERAYPAGPVVGRAPVDLAWARSRRPVLISLLAGLKGFWLDESGSMADLPAGAGRQGTLRTAQIGLDWSAPTDDCRSVADQIAAYGGSLSTWMEWDRFCDGLVLSGTPDQARAKRDLLKANFNPNSDLNKFNPDPMLARWVDKSDLLTYSTEFNLVPRGGLRIESVGRVVDSRGALRASRRLSTTILPATMVRLTTQGEFATGALGALETAGDEGAARAYGSAPYISESAGMEPTYGHRLALGGYLDGTAGARGVSLQTWPEPHLVSPAAYDGQIRLATVETPSVLTGGRVPMFLARWSGGLNSDDVGDGPDVPSLDARHPPGNTPLWADPYPGTLRTDGIYAERWCHPGYPCVGNMPPSWGTMSFWVKPNHDATRGTRHHHVYVENARMGTSSMAHINNFTFHGVFVLIQTNGVWIQGNGLGAFWRSNHEYTKERGWHANGYNPVPHRWRLVTWMWDMTGEDYGPGGSPPGGQDDSGRVFVDRGDIQGMLNDVQDDPEQYPESAGLPPLDFTQPDDRGAAYFYLGLRNNRRVFGPVNTQADATFDEFAIVDYGSGSVPQRLQAIDSSGLLARERFIAGRYYKESAYVGLGNAGNKAAEWFSAPITLPGTGTRVVGMAWTQVVPRGLRSPAVAGDPEDGDPGPEDGSVRCELVWGPLSNTGTGLLPLDSYSTVPSQPTAPFRIHAVFQPNLGDPLNRAILEPLVLDDVTILYRNGVAPRLGAWSEG